MSQYCKRCKILHFDDEICPYYLKQLKKNPGLLAEAANFTNIAGQYHLVTSQTLDGVVQGVNKVAGTHLSYEGTHQYIRDVQVFNQLNVDAYSRSGVFANAESANTYFNQATENQINNLSKQITGTGQEVDWLRWKEGKLQSLLEKSTLLGEETSNYPGIDGININRFTGDKISGVTIKANESSANIGTNVDKVLEALKKGTLEPSDKLVGVDGTGTSLNRKLAHALEKAIDSGDHDYADKLKIAQEQLKVQELNTTESVKQSTERLKDKMAAGNAYSTTTLQEVSKMAAQGAIIGAVVGLTVSSVTNYLKYQNGEITEKEAFQAIGQDTLKGALTGSAISTASIFIPSGAVGFVAGMAIGIYLNKALTNILDEVFGKGAYLEILHASGFIYGMATSLEESIKRIAKDEQKVSSDVKKVREKTKIIDQKLDEFDSIMKGDF